jgi:hypothetical protein
MKLPQFHTESNPRILLFYYAVAILLITSGISSAGFILNNAYVLLAGFVLWIVWFALIFVILLPQTGQFLSQHINLLKRGALIIFITLFMLGLAEGVSAAVLFPRLLRNNTLSGNFRELINGLEEVYQYNDGTALSQQAAENLLNGQNPYAHANIVQALLKYNAAFDRTTPLRVGAFANDFPYPTNAELQQLWNQAIQNPSQIPAELESKVCYPAGAFLLPAPFIFLGITDIRIIYALFVLAGLAYAVLIVPKQKRLLFIGVLLISLDLWNSIAGGETGSICFPLLLVAWLSLKRNFWLSTICMGLAVTTKQTAWFFLPFYLILLFRMQGMKKMLVVLSVIAGVFLITNLPFIVAEAKLWLSSMVSPMTDPMFPVGGGLTIFATGSFFNIHSSLPFTIVEVIVFLGAVYWYFRYGHRYPQTGPLLAIIPPFFAWRSLWSYFFYAALISLAYIMVNENTTQKTPSANINNLSSPSPRVRIEHE